MKTAGRKRSFDKNKALDTAMKVFWSNGYAGTSLTDLTSALGINKPSLYAAFGNKEQLFLASLAHYIEHYGTPSLNELSESPDLSFRQRLENYLQAQIGLISGELSPKGCFIVNSCCESDGGEMSAEMNHSIQNFGAGFEKTLREMFKTEQKNGGIDAAVDTNSMATFILSFMYGQAVMAKRGKSQKELAANIQHALDMMNL